MGEAADAILEGDDCQVCGMYIGGGDGFPRTCFGCRDEDDEQPRRKNHGNRPFIAVKNAESLQKLEGFLDGVHYTYVSEDFDKLKNPMFRLMFDKYPEKDHAFGVETRGIVVVARSRLLKTVKSMVDSKRRPG